MFVWMRVLLKLATYFEELNSSGRLHFMGFSEELSFEAMGGSFDKLFICF